jgi:hypothetical protein
MSDEAVGGYSLLRNKPLTAKRKKTAFSPLMTTMITTLLLRPFVWAAHRHEDSEKENEREISDLFLHIIFLVSGNKNT